MKIKAESAELADALRTDPSRAPSVREAALRGRVQARSDIPKGILLVGLSPVAAAGALAYDQLFVVMPVFLAATGAALVSRGARAQRHARVLEDALATASLSDGTIPPPPSGTSPWTASILPGLAATPSVPPPVAWDPAAASTAEPTPGPAAGSAAPPNVWSL